MRRLVVTLMILLMALLLATNISILGRMVAKSDVFLKLENISYFHFVVIYRYGHELVYLMLILSGLAFAGWLMQIKNPIQPRLLRHLTSLSLFFHLFYVLVILSVIPLVVMKGSDIDLGYPQTFRDTILFLFNYFGYDRIVIGSAILCSIIFSLTFLPILHCRLVKRENRWATDLRNK